MKAIKALFQKYRQFILFCLVGASNTAITLVSTNLLRYLGMNEYIAWTIGYALGILNGYLWSSGVVFRQKRSTGNLIKFIVVNLSVYGVSLLLLNLFEERMDLPPLLSQVFTLCVTIVLNFTLNRIWTFRAKKET